MWMRATPARFDDRGVMRYDDPLPPAGSAAVAVKFDAQASPRPSSN